MSCHSLSCEGASSLNVECECFCPARRSMFSNRMNACVIVFCDDVLGLTVCEVWQRRCVMRRSVVRKQWAVILTVCKASVGTFHAEKRGLKEKMRSALARGLREAERSVTWKQAKKTICEHLIYIIKCHGHWNTNVNTCRFSVASLIHKFVTKQDFYTPTPSATPTLYQVFDCWFDTQFGNLRRKFTIQCFSGALGFSFIHSCKICSVFVAKKWFTSLRESSEKAAVN